MKFILTFLAVLAITPLQAQILESNVTFAFKFHVEGSPQPKGDTVTTPLNVYSIKTADIIQAIGRDHQIEFTKAARILLLNIYNETHLEDSKFVIRDKGRPDFDIGDNLDINSNRDIEKYKRTKGVGTEVGIKFSNCNLILPTTVEGMETQGHSKSDAKRIPSKTSEAIISFHSTRRDLSGSATFMIKGQPEIGLITGTIKQARNVFSKMAQ